MQLLQYALWLQADRLQVSCSQVLRLTPKDQIIYDIRSIVTKTATALNQAKTTAANKDPYNEMALSRAAKEVSDVLATLLSSLGAGSNRECEEAMEAIIDSANSMNRAKLSEPNSTQTPEVLRRKKKDAPTFKLEDSLQEVSSASKSLGS